MSDGCADVEPLHSAWVDGALDDAERAVVSGHLQGCPACRADVDSLGRTRALLRNVPMRRLPPEIDIVPPPPSRSARRRTSSTRLARRVPQRLATGVAVVMALIGGAAFAFGTQPSGQQDLVTVPVDLFVADHLVHTVGGPMSTPVVVSGRR